MVDSCILIDWMRKAESPVLRLEPFLRAHRIVSCAIIRAEVVRGILDREVKEEIGALFDVIPEIPLSAARWKDLAETAWALDRKGNILPLTDLAIAACALASEAVVVTTDPHFKRIPGLKVRKDLPGVNTIGIEGAI